ncbi:MAG TPA: zinc ribbon domain-containing protein [Anaerolineales bacterium]|nr:zinc ribbon domain-containing protein [Anaerolineales bacterium]
MVRFLQYQVEAVHMRRWRLAMVILGVALMLVPGSAAAQTPIAFSGMLVQLWPEYDQPSMLVLYDFQVAPGTQLPASVTIRIPKEANLTAVAVHGEGDALLNADYRDLSADDTWQSVAIQIQNTSTYRVEYVQPLSRTGQQRQFHYEWPGDYSTQDFNLSVRMPADATAVTDNPRLKQGEAAGSTYWLGQDFGALAVGTAFTYELTYSRESESPVEQQGGLTPSRPLDANTPGRVATSNYLPYFLAALGVVLIGGGAFYFWQAGRGRKPRQARHRAALRRPLGEAEDIYCHSCGTRAQAGDRFCRVCGTRLRPSE